MKSVIVLTFIALSFSSTALAEGIRKSERDILTEEISRAIQGNNFDFIRNQVQSGSDLSLKVIYQLMKSSCNLPGDKDDSQSEDPGFGNR